MSEHLDWGISVDLEKSVKTRRKSNVKIAMPTANFRRSSSAGLTSKSNLEGRLRPSKLVLEVSPALENVEKLCGGHDVFLRLIFDEFFTDFSRSGEP